MEEFVSHGPPFASRSRNPETLDAILLTYSEIARSLAVILDSYGEMMKQNSFD